MKVTQRERVKQMIEMNGCITSLMAIRELGCTRLSARIWELRHEENIDIKHKDVTRVNRFGESVVFRVYYLEDYQEKCTSPIHLARWNKLVFGNYKVHV